RVGANDLRDVLHLRTSSLHRRAPSKSSTNTQKAQKTRQNVVDDSRETGTEPSTKTATGTVHHVPVVDGSGGGRVDGNGACSGKPSTTKCTKTKGKPRRVDDLDGRRRDREGHSETNGYTHHWGKNGELVLNDGWQETTIGGCLPPAQPTPEP